MTFNTAVAERSGNMVVCITANPGVWLRAWVADLANSFKTPFKFTPSSVLWNATTALTLQSSAATVNSNAGSYWTDGTYIYVRPPSGQSIYSGTIQAIVPQYFSNYPKNYSGTQYDARIKSTPSISQRIEARFGGVAQIGGGTVTLINSDGYFDSKMDWQWDAGLVTIKLGLDIDGSVATTSDLQQIAVWAVDQHSKTQEGFTLRLVDSRTRIKAKIPVDTFTRTAFPNIEPSEEGKTIPTVYGKVLGVKPTAVDPALKQFKVASHAVTSFDGVRIKQEIDELFSVYFVDFLPYTSPLYRKYLPSVEILQVKNNGALLAKVDSVGDCSANANSYYYAESWLYINVGTNSIGILAEYQRKSSRWVASSFSSYDLSSATFILGVDWSIGQDVSVDFTGKSGSTGPEIIQDLLTVAGETAINTSSFTTAKAAFIVGTDSYNVSTCKMCLGLNIDKPRELAQIIGDINAVAHTFVYSDSSGNFSIGAFEPKPVALVYSISDLDLIDITDSMEPADVANSFVTNWAKYTQEDYSQTYTHTRSEGINLHNQPEDIIVEKDVPFTDEADAILYTQRTSLMRSRPLRKLTVTLHWKGWLFGLGDQVSLNFKARGIAGKFEVIERTADVVSSRIRLVLGDLRGFGDSVGFWVADAPTLPTAFAALTGYGSGSAASWNSSWHADIKAWARRNVGYWTDDNGLADSTDPDSFMSSTWF